MNLLAYLFFPVFANVRVCAAPFAEFASGAIFFFARYNWIPSCYLLSFLICGMVTNPSSLLLLFVLFVGNCQGYA